MQGILPGAVLLTVVLGMPAMASPRLVVVISVDQMRADYLDRFAPALTGGLKFLSEKSVRYKNAHHRHALTQTAPGHLTILSGRHPGPAGVPANEFYDPTQRRIIYCVEDTQAVQLNGARPGMSFRRVDATTIGDWLKDASPKSQVYSVAGKDRSAILMGGRRPDGVYWYDRDSGDFMTSDYYADTFPVFIQAFNAAKWPDRFYGQAWTRIEPETLYERLAGPDDHPGEAAWGEEEAPVFPHWLKTASGLPDGEFYRAFYQTPFIDEYVLELAREIIRQNKLGRDRHVDLLAISLSATDPIGHGFGPNSHEVMDSILRIDRHLGRFLDFLEKEISLKETLIVLTSDHGVLPLIEWLSNRNISAERAGRRVREFQKRVATEVRNKYGPPSKLFLFQGREVYYLDRPYLAANDTSYTSILADIRFWASSETWISRIYDRDQLMSGERLNAVGEQLRHSFHPSIGADLYFIPRPYVYTSGYPNGTGHGTPYSYDNHVPLLWYDPARPPVEISDTVYTVDIAPTLAERIGLRPPEMLDGQVLPANP